MHAHDHLDAILRRLGNDRARLASAATQSARAYYSHAVSMTSKELDAEYAFLGIAPASDEDLLASLA